MQARGVDHAQEIGRPANRVLGDKNALGEHRRDLRGDRRVGYWHGGAGADLEETVEQTRGVISQYRGQRRQFIHALIPMVIS